MILHDLPFPVSQDLIPLPDTFTAKNRVEILGIPVGSLLMPQ